MTIKVLPCNEFANRRASQKPVQPAFNVAQNGNTNLNEIMEMIKKNSKNNPKVVKKDFRLGDVFKTYASIEKLEKINFSPKISIEKGIELTYNWYYSFLSE